MTIRMKMRETKSRIEKESCRSAWGNGVKLYAYDILDDMIDNADAEASDISESMFVKAMLNGAKDWKDYSWGGCSLIYNQDIANRLCNASELKKTKGGINPPNNKEEWLDTQARALYQAANKVLNIFFSI